MTIKNKRSPKIKKGGMFGNNFFSYVDTNGHLQFTNYCVELNDGIQKYGIFKPDGSGNALQNTTSTIDIASKYSDDYVTIYNSWLELYTKQQIENNLIYLLILINML